MGILFISLFTVTGGYLFWQFQANRAIEAFGADNSKFIWGEETNIEQELVEGSRLVIDKIGVSMPLVESRNESALLYGAWRSPKTSTPDKGGNTVIFGHRYLNLPPSKNTLFRLNEIKIGDIFEVVWKEETYYYRVTEKFVVEPTQLEVLEETEVSTVTLITCTPLFTTNQRLIVRGELME